MEVLAFMVFKHLGPAQLFSCMRVCKYWRTILKNKKLMLQIMQDVCQRDLWPRYIAQASKTFLSNYNNWRHMMKERPFIRFDGVYVNKMHYVRYGLQDEYGLRPQFDVVTYKYLRFYRNGTMVSIYTSVAPEKFIPKFYEKQMTFEQLMNSDLDEDND